MLRFILLAILLMAVARFFWRAMAVVMTAARSPQSSGNPAVKLVRDPVCGTFVKPKQALSLTAAGNTHYFCSEQCKATFRSTPGA